MKTVVSDKLRNLFADIFAVPANSVTPELAAESLDKWDSFGHLQLILALELEFGVKFDPERIPLLNTVALLQQELESKGVNLEDTARSRVDVR